MALTTVARLKSFLGIKPDDQTIDARLEFFVAAGCRTVESLTGRTFDVATYVETVSGTGSDTLIPMHYPIISIASLNTASDRDFSNPVSLLSFGDYGIADSGNEIVSYGGRFRRGINNIQYTYSAGYAAIPADLELAATWCAQWYYQLDSRKDLGRTSKSKGDESTSISESLPQIIRDIIQSYKRYEIPNVTQSVRMV